MLFNFVERSSAFHVKMSEDLLLEDPDSKKVGKQCQFLKIFVEEFFFIRNTFLEQPLALYAPIGSTKALNQEKVKVVNKFRMNL